MMEVVWEVASREGASNLLPHRLHPRHSNYGRCSHCLELKLNEKSSRTVLNRA